MISGSSVPPFYYSLMCEKENYLIYSTIIWISTSAAAISLMNPSLMKSQQTWVNATVFVSAGFSPIFGLVYINNFTENSVLHHFDLWPWVTGGALYVIGAVFYAWNWPERLVNGRFDMIGNSHNIFHVFIVLAALIHWYGSVRVFHERQLYQCPITSALS